MMDYMPKSQNADWDRFKNFVRGIVNVPHSEIKRELDKEKKQKERRKRAKTSPASPVSNDR